MFDPKFLHPTYPFREEPLNKVFKWLRFLFTLINFLIVIILFLATFGFLLEIFGITNIPDQTGQLNLVITALISTAVLIGLLYLSNLIFYKLQRSTIRDILKSFLSQLLIWVVISSIIEALIEPHLNSITFALISRLVELSLAIFIFGIYKKEVWSSLNPKPFRLILIPVMVLLGILVHLLPSIILVLIAHADLHSASQAQVKDLFPVLPKNPFQIIMFVIPPIILAPIFEELLFRGLIFTKLATRFSIPLAMVVSSILFGLFHTPNPVIFASTFIFGLLQCLIYLKYKNIKYTMITHSVGNILAISILLIK